MPASAQFFTDLLRHHYIAIPLTLAKAAKRNMNLLEQGGCTRLSPAQSCLLPKGQPA